MNELLEQLNGLAPEEYRDTAWWDVVYTHPLYDPAATDAADPSGQSDVIVLLTGEKIWYDPRRGEWVQL